MRARQRELTLLIPILPSSRIIHLHIFLDHPHRPPTSSSIQRVSHPSPTAPNHSYHAILYCWLCHHCSIVCISKLAPSIVLLPSQIIDMLERTSSPARPHPSIINGRGRAYQIQSHHYSTLLLRLPWSTQSNWSQIANNGERVSPSRRCPLSFGWTSKPAGNGGIHPWSPG